jgi:hypothetical protein
MTRAWLRSTSGTRIRRQPNSHLKGFLELFVERFVSIFDASRFVVYGSPHDDLKADLEAWNPVYLSYWGGFRR